MFTSTPKNMMIHEPLTVPINLSLLFGGMHGVIKSGEVQKLCSRNGEQGTCTLELYSQAFGPLNSMVIFVWARLIIF